MKKITILAVLIAFTLGFRFLNSASSKVSSFKYHSPDEIEAYMDTLKRAPIAAGEYFLPSSSCRGCHGYDSAHTASIDEAGNDVNLVSRWESSMMALSAKDPFWKAKVRQEIMINPGHAGDLQNRCLDCHAPLGAYTSKYHGNAFYTLEDLANDTLGKDGVSCGGCHAIGPVGLGTGNFYSGSIPYDTNHVEYGPFTAPFVGAMQLYEGLTPVFSAHMDMGKACSSCHTLITNTSDLSGNYTGGHFVEQATYHEYVNSDFPANNIKCQTCHMPQVADPIILSNSTSGLTPRSPFNQHTFQGSNHFMLNLIKNNKDSLGVYVEDDKFDSTIVATSVMLKKKSIDMNIILDSVTADTAYYRVKIKNKTGHKFPSGYPSRRAVLQMVITDANDTIFSSGLFNTQQRVIGENIAFEPHHAVIKQSNVPQIYELAPGDVNNNFTSILERASVVLKDNRIPPTGFTTSSPVYDTTVISADALADDNFNRNGSTQGSGTDYVHVHAPISGHVGSLKISAKMYYQAVPPKWVDELFAMSAPEINKFKAMYQSADQRPFLMVSDSLTNVNLTTGTLNAQLASEIKIWPTISIDGRINISAGYGDLIKEVDVYTNEGKNPVHFINAGYQTDLTIELPSVPGVYYFKIRTASKTYYKKVVKS
ncbi:MAG: hypothetical protein K0Q95_2942 [Bacteroidota bacterium]|jgi:hypothetical protein|nr:hypothetical protein [Bacteroidota bacterium]